MTTEQVLLRLTRAHAYPRNAGRVNQELTRLMMKDRDARFGELDRRSAALARKQKATPQS